MSSCGRLLSNNGSATFLFVHFQSKKKTQTKLKDRVRKKHFLHFYRESVWPCIEI